MRNKIRKALKKTFEKTAGVVSPKKRKASRAIRNSVSLWMDRSKDFVSTFPTLTELREELTDWNSYDRVNLRELSTAE